MKKNSRKHRKKKGGQSLEALLDQLDTPPPQKGLKESTLKKFFLYALYYLNIQFETSKAIAKADKQELEIIIDCIASKFDQKFADQCRKIITSNFYRKSRSAQNKSLRNDLVMSLQTGHEAEKVYREVSVQQAASRTVLKFLLKLNAGDSVNKHYKLMPGKEGKKATLLVLSCYFSSTDLIGELIDSGADYKTQDQRTCPLLLCTERNCATTVSYLFQTRRVDIKSEALKVAIYKKVFASQNAHILQLLVENKFFVQSELESEAEHRSDNPLLMCELIKSICREGENKNSIKLLGIMLQAGYRVDGVDDLGNTVLSYTLDYKIL